MRFNQLLLNHLKNRQDVKLNGLTAYLEKIASNHSKFVDHLKIKK